MYVETGTLSGCQSCGGTQGLSGDYDWLDIALNSLGLDDTISNLSNQIHSLCPDMNVSIPEIYSALAAEVAAYGNDLTRIKEIAASTAIKVCAKSAAKPKTDPHTGQVLCKDGTYVTPPAVCAGGVVNLPKDDDDTNWTLWIILGLVGAGAAYYGFKKR